MPFYAGKTAGVKFNNTFMTADSWSAEIRDEPIDLTTVNVYRNSNIVGALSVSYPAWDKSGTPTTFVNGGIRETSIKLKGKHSGVANLPDFGDYVSVTILNNANIIFKSENALVISALYNNEVAKSMEFELELRASATSNSNDTDVLPRL